MLSTWIDKEKDAEEFLYHYKTIETLLLYILPQKMLIFSDIRKTNDPEEIYDHGFQMSYDLELGIDSKDECIEEFIPNQQRFSDALRKEVKILCCSQDNCPKQFDFVRNTGRGFLKPRMWAQYSNNHKGVCLVLNRKKFIEKFNSNFHNRFHMSREIIYEFDYEKLEKSIRAYTLNTSELKGRDIEEVVADRIESFTDIYYFSKHPDWKEENEYRFLIKAKPNENPKIELDGILNSIILGTQADDLLYKPIEIMVEKFSYIPDIYKLNYFNNSYFLVPLKESN